MQTALHRTGVVIDFLMPLIRGEPERAPNARLTYGKFAVPMYVCMSVAIRRPRAYHACAYGHDVNR